MREGVRCWAERAADVNQKRKPVTTEDIQHDSFLRVLDIIAFYIHKWLWLNDVYSLRNDHDNRKQLWPWSFQLHDWILFLHYLELGFLSLATKKVWTKHPIFWGIYFNHIRWHTEPQAETVVHRCLTLIRSSDSSFLPIVFRWSEFGKHHLAEMRSERHPAASSQLGDPGEGDLLPLPGCPAPGKMVADLMSLFRPHLVEQQAPQCSCYLPRHRGCQWTVYFVTNRLE